MYSEAGADVVFNTPGTSGGLSWSRLNRLNAPAVERSFEDSADIGAVEGSGGGGAGAGVVRGGGGATGVAIARLGTDSISFFNLSLQWAAFSIHRLAIPSNRCLFLMNCFELYSLCFGIILIHSNAQRL